MRSPRNIELALLLAAAPVVLVAFGLADSTARREFQLESLVIPALLFAAFAVAHLAVRTFAPASDPGLLPVAFVLCGIGLAFVTRLNVELASSQVIWLFVGVAVLIATLVSVRSLEALARYKYTIMIAGIVLLILPAVFGTEVNGAKLWIRVGGYSFQPGEIAKILIILFLAAYLAENREVLSVSTRKVFGIGMPPLKQLGPMLLMWAISLFVLIFERDLGSSLLLFGIFLVMLFAATGRALYVVAGVGLFAAGATAAYYLFDHVQDRIAIWLDPFADATGRGYQLVQSLFALAAGRVVGVGIGRGMPDRIPFIETDFIFSAVGEEMGLLGAAGILICFLILSLRGLATAARAKSDMAALTAVGLVAAIALQTFVIVGGVTRLIPLTGVTLPFVSYGGSSLLSTFIALALLLRAGDDATGRAVELQMSSVGDAGVLGRLALSRRLVSIALAVSVLFALLTANLTLIQTVRADELANHPANTRVLAEELEQDRGAIVTRDGTVLATSVPDGRQYRREYPEGTFASHTVGYFSARYGRAGVEAAENQALTGQRAFASFGDLVDAAAGVPVRGNDVILTISTPVQRAAEATLGDRQGACVVLDPRSGEVLAMAASPRFDPETVDAEWDSLDSDPSAPLLDRARLGLYPPGSTFKIVTLTTGIASGVATPESTYPGPGTIEIGNAPVTNFEGGSYGELDLETATARSVNTVFAQLAVDVGAEALVDQSERFGFNRENPYELPVRTSLMPDPAEMTTWETAWAGVGQPVGEHESPPGPQATVLEMALVAAGIANAGDVMRPYVVERIADQAGQTISTTESRRWLKATDPTTAATVRDVMVGVVENGSGAAARIGGASVAGKTGTAETGKQKNTNAWFIAFAPAEDPRVAMAIMLEEAGVGGRVAAPAAKPVLEAALAAQGVGQ